MNNSEKAFSYITGLVMKGNFESVPFSSEFFQEAAIALREKIDRSKGCQWCMNPLPNTNVFMQDCERIVLDIPLRFCPNCGRYLRESPETGTSHSA